MLAVDAEDDAVVGKGLRQVDARLDGLRLEQLVAANFALLVRLPVRGIVADGANLDAAWVAARLTERSKISLGKDVCAQ